MKIKLLIPFVGFVALLPACNLFGFNQPEQPPLPTTIQELTLSETSPDSGSPPEYNGVHGQSKDGQPIEMDITLVFKIDPTMSDRIQKKWGASYVTSFLIPTLRHTTEEAISKYTAYEIYGEGRYDLIKTLQTSVIQNFSTEGFIVNDVLIRTIRFTPEFTAKIEQEIIATMTAEAQQLTITPTP